MREEIGKPRNADAWLSHLKSVKNGQVWNLTMLNKRMLTMPVRRLSRSRSSTSTRSSACLWTSCVPSYVLTSDRGFAFARPIESTSHRPLPATSCEWGCRRTSNSHRDRDARAAIRE